MNTMHVVSSWRMLRQSHSPSSLEKDRVVFFQVAINWLMLDATSDGLLGFQWTLFSHLEDHDFADDLAVISAALSHLQKRCDKLRNFSRSVFQP